MAQVLKNLTNSIWHAFNALQLENQVGAVAKSKLKVLTANIGTLLDLYGVEKGLEHYRSTSTLTFEHFIFYLQKEVFSSLTESTTMETCRNLEQGVDEICWLVCRKTYLDRSNPLYTDSSVYQLFRIFCLLAEVETDALEGGYIVTMHSDEVARIASQLASSLGLCWDPADFNALSAAIGTFRFSTFLAVLESKYSGDGNLDIDGVIEAIEDLYQTYVEDVIKKGYLMKKGYLLPTHKGFWFVLRPGELTYYKDSQQKEVAGSITLDSNSWADSATSGGHKPDRRFILCTPEHKCIELVAEDHRGRLQWLSALQIAIEHAGEKVSYQRGLALRRRSARLACKQEKEETRQELLAERQARIAAEIQARKLEALSKKECARVQELEDVKQRLEALLEEEKLALRDEEIVRGLQARILNEEWEKREQLERLQQEQLNLLEMEKMKRLEFETKQQENERQLQEAKLRLQQLEREKENLDAELRAAREKFKRAEEAQIILETQLVATRPKNGERIIRRSQSFIPTTKERPLMVDERLIFRKNF